MIVHTLTQVYIYEYTEVYMYIGSRSPCIVRIFYFKFSLIINSSNGIMCRCKIFVNMNEKLVERGLKIEFTFRALDFDRNKSRVIESIEFH